MTGLTAQILDLTEQNQYACLVHVERPDYWVKLPNITCEHVGLNLVVRYSPSSKYCLQQKPFDQTQQFHQYNHQLGSVELPYLKSAREEVALKVSKGIPPERILDGMF